MVKQKVSCVSVRFDDEAVGQFFDEQVDLGRRPEQFARCWCHTHPGNSPEPSPTDEDTFERVFGNCQWAVMCIIARDNSTYARIRFNVGPGGDILIPTEVDYASEFEPSDHNGWDTEYALNVQTLNCLADPSVTKHAGNSDELDGTAISHDMIDELESMDPFQRRLILDELAERPELWDDEEEVILL